MKAAAKWRFGDDALRGKRVAIQGLGSVGLHLGRFLREEGAQIVGSDIDHGRIETARAELDAEIVAPDDIYGADCDVFAPCALGAVLNPNTIPRLRCAIVAGAANNQLADEVRDRDAIHARGITYAPDYVINAGGLINVYSELTGYKQERAMRMARGIYDNVWRVLERAQRESVPTAVAADHLAESRIAAVRGMGPQHWDRTILGLR
jgi:leucine dehydrogenase